MTLNVSWVALALLRHVGQKTLANLLATFGNPDAILSASVKDLVQVKGVGKKIASAITAVDVDAISHKIDDWHRAGVHIIPQTAATFPRLLDEIPDKPLILFAIGQYQPQNWQPAVAIVGTRRPTAQSVTIATKLSQDGINKGQPVISGLALGIDQAAHHSALIHGGTTIAVLGGGVLNVYPPDNRQLAQTILENDGAILSENPPNAEATAPRLVMRNRLLSGLCQQLIVVQSAADGGAMHAARAAQKQGRTLYVVDLPFSGNQTLLKNGAHPINPDNPVIPSKQ